MGGGGGGGGSSDLVEILRVTSANIIQVGKCLIHNPSSQVQNHPKYHDLVKIHKSNTFVGI